MPQTLMRTIFLMRVCGQSHVPVRTGRKVLKPSPVVPAGRAPGRVRPERQPSCSGRASVEFMAPSPYMHVHRHPPRQSGSMPQVTPRPARSAMQAPAGRSHVIIRLVVVRAPGLSPEPSIALVIVPARGCPHPAGPAAHGAGHGAGLQSFFGPVPGIMASGGSFQSAHRPWRGPYGRRRRGRSAAGTVAVSPAARGAAPAGRGPGAATPGTGPARPSAGRPPERRAFRRP